MCGGACRGAALVESTSGNLGVALASAARALGISFTAVVDPSLSPVLAERMTGLGAELSEVSRRDAQGGYLSARLDRVAALLAAEPALVWTDQYHNPANPLAHCQGTGPELHKQAPGSMDAVFVAVSTGGTLAGLGRYLRGRQPKARVIAVDVPGSRVFADPAGTRLLTGIGASRPSAFLRPGDWDDVVIVDDADTVSHCHTLAETTGIRLGGSSGAVLAACARYLAEHPEITSPVCVCPDSGGNYTQTLYAPKWLADRAGLPLGEGDADEFAYVEVVVDRLDAQPGGQDPRGVLHWCGAHECSWGRNAAGRSRVTSTPCPGRARPAQQPAGVPAALDQEGGGAESPGSRPRPRPRPGGCCRHGRAGACLDRTGGGDAAVPQLAPRIPRQPGGDPRPGADRRARRHRPAR